MTTLSAALEARDKATKGPWVVNEKRAMVDAADGEPICALAWPHEKRSERETKANATIQATAPDALDWIAKALPWISEKHGETKELLKRIRTEEDAGEWSKEIPGLEEDLETLTALIAQAEGKKGGEG